MNLENSLIEQLRNSGDNGPPSKSWLFVILGGTFLRLRPILSWFDPTATSGRLPSTPIHVSTFMHFSCLDYASSVHWSALRLLCKSTPHRVPPDQLTPTLHLRSTWPLGHLTPYRWGKQPFKVSLSEQDSIWIPACVLFCSLVSFQRHESISLLFHKVITHAARAIPHTPLGLDI